jgi:hypothetical protein
MTLVRLLYMLIYTLIIILCSLYSSLNFFILFYFLAAIPLIFSTTYDFTLGESTLVLLRIAVSYALGGFSLVLIDSYTVKRHVLRSKATMPPPEQTLWGAMIGGPLMARALF